MHKADALNELPQRYQLARGASLTLIHLHTHTHTPVGTLATVCLLLLLLLLLLCCAINCRAKRMKK